MSRADVFAQLQQQIGTEVKVGPWLTVTQTMIDDFAAATRDTQWIHVDPARAAAESPFGATIAHGYLTLSLIPYLMGNVDAETPRYPGVRMGVNYGLNRVRFPHPVVVGARIRARVTLQDVTMVGEDALHIVNRVTVELENAAKPACVAEALSRVYF